MKTNFLHLPAEKQKELSEIIAIIRQHSAVEMIILFGSYARGDWREKLTEDGQHFVYQSDFDILLVVETRSTTQQASLQRDIAKEIEQTESIKTPVSLITHDFEFVNRRVRRTQYFFSDIQKQGVLLYDSGKFVLAEPGPLNPTQRYLDVKKDFAYWFNSAEGFFDSSQYNYNKKRNSLAAFELHQTVERLYSTILLVYTHYKPNTHDLAILRKLVNALDPRFTEIFPLTDNVEKYHFLMLCNAYVEARYKPSYAITKEELNWLKERVQQLMNLTNMFCQEKITFFEREKAEHTQ
ncbi:MAG TPA: HEPN domain-containing protein [Gammaproteobacteria bacterium]|nr:HEPN domain-containing protein [Gammaproteobacteria bacterium]